METIFTIDVWNNAIYIYLYKNDTDKDRYESHLHAIINKCIDQQCHSCQCISNDEYTVCEMNRKDLNTVLKELDELGLNYTLK